MADMSREVIAVDADEVSFPFLTEFTKYHNQQFGTSYRPDEFDSYYFHKVMGLTRQEVKERIFAFHDVDDSLVPPIEGSKTALDQIAQHYDIVTVTARHPQFQEQTRRWLVDIHEMPFRDVYAIGHEDTAEHPRSKVEVCQEIGAVALIDDSPKHLMDCGEAGMDGILFGDYSWNQAKEELPERVTRCVDWPAVLHYFGIDVSSTV
jgi:uncharacterized HAD superfamily protein